ncbi:unnamed protein product [Strongylus vulgaris]|uniref:Uncharacterized protein n=1 Tax=Strongylus vulgaris TaxID=40348 RepID=A0A3P7IIN6_STRVU|nr:unnamed protein product [Strongylus vulgaris]
MCVLVTTIKGSVEAIDVAEGVHIWFYQTDAPVFSPVVTIDNSGFIASVDGTITKIWLNEGKKEVAVNVREPVFSSISIFDDLMYIVTERGSLIVADLNEGGERACAFRLAAEPGDIKVEDIPGWIEKRSDVAKHLVMKYLCRADEDSAGLQVLLFFKAVLIRHESVARLLK